MYEMLLTGRGLLFVLVVLGLDAWAVFKTWRGAGSTATRAAWTAVIVLLPLLGLVVWALAGPDVSRPEAYEREPP
jgi:hypothetical protein